MVARPSTPGHAIRREPLVASRYVSLAHGPAHAPADVINCPLFYSFKLQNAIECISNHPLFFRTS